MHQLLEKQPQNGLSLQLDEADTEKYRLEYERREGLQTAEPVQTVELTEFKERRDFSQLTLCAEIARYLNRSPLEIEDILANTQEGIKEILESVNTFNELLYDWIIPRLFDALYDLKEFEHHEPEEIELVKTPEDGHYTVSATSRLIAEESAHHEPEGTPETRESEGGYHTNRTTPNLVAKETDTEWRNYTHKSFHLDTYVFDSLPERRLFWYLMREEKVKQVYFTGMLTHGQSDFYIQYIDPESHVVRQYYPDFLMQKDDDSWVIVEVKGDNMIDDKIVLAKAAATQQRANASDMSYKIIKGTDATDGRYQALFE